MVKGTGTLAHAKTDETMAAPVEEAGQKLKPMEQAAKILTAGFSSSGSYFWWHESCGLQHQWK